MAAKEAAHLPVLAEEVVGYFEESAPSLFIDGTLGAGGHAAALLQRVPSISRYIGFDRDGSALELAVQRLRPYPGRWLAVNTAYSNMSDALAKMGIFKVDGILLDLGVSSMQLDRPERGFSFSKDGPLDMRMDRTSSLSAEEVVNGWSEKAIGEVLRDFGEEPKWKEAARAICAARRRQKIATTGELAEVLASVLKRRGKLHPLTLVFQGLRIAVNDEFGELRRGLQQGIELLAEGGRMAVISFHSGEDRIVKQFFRDLAGKGKKSAGSVRLLTKKVLQPSFREIKKNPRSRSARLRVAEKLTS